MQNQFFKCKNCNSTINSEDLYSHYKKCQQQLKADQENKQTKYEQQKKEEENEDLYGDCCQNEKIIQKQKNSQIMQTSNNSKINGSGELNIESQIINQLNQQEKKSQILQLNQNSRDSDYQKETKSQILQNTQANDNQNNQKQKKSEVLQNPQYIEQQEQKIVKNVANNNQINEKESQLYGQCIYCQKEFLIQELDDHYDNCEAGQFLISQHISEQEPVPVPQQQQSSNDSEEDWEDVEEEVLDGGVIKRTIINKDERTGFTHYRTYYKYPNQNEENQQQIEEEEHEHQRENQKSPLVEIVFQPSSSLSDENTQCCICYEKYQKNQKLTLLDCMHRFHKKCIYIWLEQKTSCPICKFEVNDQF